MTLSTRRTIQRICWLILIADLCVMLSGCTLAWTTEISNLIPLLGAAATAIVAVLVALGKKVSPTTLDAFTKWEADAQAALVTINNLVAQYKTAEAAAQPGLITEIETAANTIAGGLTQILPELQITDPATQAVIIAVVKAFNAAMQGVLNLIPVLKGTVTPLMAGAVIDADEVKARVKAAPTAKQFQHDFDAEMDKVSAVSPEVPKGKFHIKGKSNAWKLAHGIKDAVGSAAGTVDGTVKKL
jgi:hypothetical protein